MSNVAEELLSLSSRVRRLVPSHKNPENFHMEKSEIAYRLEQLSDVAEEHTAPRLEDCLNG